MNRPIRTLIVDDSAFARKSVRQMLENVAGIEVVGMARNGEEALSMVADLAPDIVTCDLTMPEVDGVEFVRRQMRARPVPILVVTASPRDGQRAVQALEAGAVDLIQKPSALANSGLLQIREELCRKIMGAAEAAMGPLTGASLGSSGGAAVAPAAIIKSPKRKLKADIVLIGVSTGGPQALRYLLAKFLEDFPVPIGIVLHMPVGYTALFATKLNEISPLKVMEAAGGEKLEPGVAILAKAGHHLQFRRSGGPESPVETTLINRPLDKPHRPSVDIMFQSAAEVYGERVLAVVLTGMGNDGMEGAAWIKAKGGTVLTEAEESCVIYGMPRSVVDAGLSDGSAPLNRMQEAIYNAL